MHLLEYGDLGTLANAIHTARVFAGAAQPGGGGGGGSMVRRALRSILRTAQEVALGLYHMHLQHMVHGGAYVCGCGCGCGGVGPSLTAVCA
jgi:hypothetical protein